jgi:hypothetical protein
MPTPFDLSYAALWIVVIFQGVLLLGVVRLIHQVPNNGEAADGTLDGTLKGQRVPDFSVTDVAGASLRSADMRGHQTALLFVSPNCSTCNATLYEMEALDHKSQGNLVTVCRGTREECVGLIGQHELRARAVIDESDRLGQLFSASTFPTAIIIDEHGRVSSVGFPKRGEEMTEILNEASASGVST